MQSAIKITDCNDTSFVVVMAMINGEHRGIEIKVGGAIKRKDSPRSAMLQLFLFVSHVMCIYLLHAQ